MAEKKNRMANMELLRIVAMMMVIMLHYLGKGDLLPTLVGEIDANGYMAWALEALSVVAVNAYVLLSGYFLVESRFKLSRVLTLILQALFYSLLVPVVLVLVGIVEPESITLYQILYYMFPVQMEHYWFLTAYVIMYLFAPLLGVAVHHLNKRQHQVILGGLLCVMSVGKSVIPARLELDEFGYDALWFMTVYLVAAYIRLYGIPFFKNVKVSACLYVLGCGGIFGIAMLLNFCYLRWDVFGNFLSATYNYNHILNLFAAVALFYIFYNIRIADGWFAKLVCKISPYTLGVYLLHENLEIRRLWPGWLGAGKADNPVLLALCALAAVVCVFVIGIVADMARELIFRMVGRILDKMGVLRPVKRIDAVFAKQGSGEEKQIEGAAEKQ